MGVPTRIQEELLGTPSYRTLVLDAQTVGAHFSGDLPYRDEWIRNRCARLSPDERGRAAEAGPADLRDLRTRHSEELSCAVAVQKESRISAYEKYFGRKVLDGMH
jgi:hypothetical protein